MDITSTTIRNHILKIDSKIKQDAINMSAVIEDAIDSWIVNAAAFNINDFNVLNALKAANAKAAHAYIIKNMYARNLAELEEVLNDSPVDFEYHSQLVEAYNTKSDLEINENRSLRYSLLWIRFILENTPNMAS